MSGSPKSFDRLAAELQRLPGIGGKSAARLAYHLLRSPQEEAERLSRAISEARGAVRRCSNCNTLTESDPCEICSDPERDETLLCVVEEPGNVMAIEKTREFKGRYHVLWGALSPLRGIGPDEIDVAGLL
ncbi:MAG TPA: toprim domain-containing protein, partial [Thermoanaerobaculia bacterium]